MAFRYKRELGGILKTRLLEAPRFIQIVSGPRQTGKTTLVQQVCNSLYLEHAIDPHFIAVDNPDREEKFPKIVGTEEIRTPPKNPDIEWLVFHWERARQQLLEKEDDYTPHVLVFDEIQKIPQWSDAVKGLWDEDRRRGIKLHIVLLGSSPLLLQQGLVESLEGRFENIRSTHWSFSEMADAFNFDLDEYIYFGGYPGGASLIREQERWLDYIRGSLIEPSIKKDVLAMTRIYKPELLRLMLAFGCEYSSQEYSYNSMLGQLKDAGNTTTLAQYLRLLGNAGLLTGIQKFTTNKGTRRGSSPKLIVMNTALMSCFSTYSFQEAISDRTYWGRQVESTIGAHLINTLNANYQVYYWREGQDEVDFILCRGDQIVAIEVKSHIKRTKITGLKKFKEKFPTAKLLLVGGDGIGLQEFLSYEAQHWLD